MESLSSYRPTKAVAIIVATILITLAVVVLAKWLGFGFNTETGHFNLTTTVYHQHTTDIVVDQNMQCEDACVFNPDPDPKHIASYRGEVRSTLAVDLIWPWELISYIQSPRG